MTDSRNRGQITPKGDNKWQLRVYIGTDADGKRKYSASVFQGTFTQARQALTRKVAELDAKTFVAPSKLTVKEHCDSWLKAKEIAVKTRLDYEHRLKKDVYPEIGQVKLKDLAPGRIRDLYTTLRDIRKLSPRTRIYTHTILSQALEQAVVDGLLAKNPCEHIELPKRTKSEPLTLSAEQVSLFLEKTQTDTHYWTLWLTLLTTGLRPQEVLALEWKHFDSAGRALTISQALNQVEKGHYVVGPVKTDSSNRTVSLPETTVRALKEYQKETGAIAGFIWTGRKGGFREMSHVRRAWKKALKAAGLPAVKLHGARHSHLSMLLDADVHPKVAQERAGHSNIGITMDTYSHVLKRKHEETAGVVENILFKTKERVG
jgi:integrase